jgi:hypothetical protein
MKNSATNRALSADFDVKVVASSELIAIVEKLIDAKHQFAVPSTGETKFGKTCTTQSVFAAGSEL